MEVITIESKAFKSLVDKIEILTDYILKHQVSDKNKEDIWLDSQEVADLLRISTRTLQRLRSRKHSLYSIWNAIFYLLKTGCQCRMLPKEYPKWELVYYYYSKWRDDGTFEEVHENLRSQTRKRAGKQESPSLAIIDSQSRNMTRSGGVNKGFDGGKNVNGRKRHIGVDSMGLLLTVVVHAANDHDSKAAFKVIETLKHRFPRLVKIIADAGYRGQLADSVKNSFGWILQIVMRKDAHKFEILPQRWIVERTFSWFESYRRLSKEFEFHTYTQEAMIQLAMIKIMLNRIK